MNEFYDIESDVCTKYQEASKIVNLALQGLISQCVPGAKVMDLCKVCLFNCSVDVFSLGRVVVVWRVWLRRVGCLAS